MNELHLWCLLYCSTLDTHTRLDICAVTVESSWEWNELKRIEMKWNCYIDIFIWFYLCRPQAILEFRGSDVALWKVDLPSAWERGAARFGATAGLLSREMRDNRVVLWTKGGVDVATGWFGRFGPLCPSYTRPRVVCFGQVLAKLWE